MAALGTGEVPPGAVTVGSFFAVLWRRKVVAIAVVLLALGGAVAFSATRAPSYTAAATVNVTPADSLLPTGSSQKPVSTITEVKIVTSTSVARIAAPLLGWTKGAPELLAHVSATSPLDSQIIVIRFTSADGRRAAAGANAFADAYLSYRRTSAEAQYAHRADKFAQRITVLQRQVSAAVAKVGAAPVGSPQRTQADTLRRALQSQVDSLMTQQNQLLTVSASPGMVVTRAQTPAAAGSARLVYLVGGLLLGLVLAAAAALATDRRDDRLRSADDIEAVTRTDVLATIVTNRRRPQERARVASLVDTGGVEVEAEAYRLLAGKLLAPATSKGARKLLVTGAEGGAEDLATVPISLAVAFAAQGLRVAYAAPRRAIIDAAHLLGAVGLHADAAAQTSAVGAFEVAGFPGLFLVSLGDEVTLDGRQRHNEAGPGGLLGGADIIVLDGVNCERPSTVLTLGRLAEAAVVFAEERKTRSGDLRHWFRELTQIGLDVAGVVVVRRGRRPRLPALLAAPRASSAALPTGPHAPAAVYRPERAAVDWKGDSPVRPLDRVLD